MSLAEKYRPLAFDEVIGQPEIVKSLKRVVEEGRHHSFLFLGPSGVGKTTLARILANTFAGGKATETNMEEVNAASTSIDDIRDIVSRSYYRAIGANQSRSIILDEAHRLSPGAWDTLLKPLEQPPRHVYWMLCSTNGDKIPRTIKTRCVQYTLKPVGEDLLFNLLAGIADAEGFGTSSGVIDAIVERSEGSPRQALVYLETVKEARIPTEARLLLGSGISEPGTIELCRFLAGGRGFTWEEAVRLIKPLEGRDAESIRIGVVNYLTAVLLNAKSDARAAFLLSVLEPFLSPYTTTDKLAPLLHSVGLAIGLDKQ